VVMFDGRVTTEFGAGTFSQEQLVAAMVGHELASEGRQATTAGPVGRAGKATTSRRADGLPGAQPQAGAQPVQGLRWGEAT
jgi:ABC-type sugar transport system ATPase subunit